MPATNTFEEAARATKVAALVPTLEAIAHVRGEEPAALARRLDDSAWGIVASIASIVQDTRIHPPHGDATKAAIVSALRAARRVREAVDPFDGLDSAAHRATEDLRARISQRAGRA